MWTAGDIEVGAGPHRAARPSLLELRAQDMAVEAVRLSRRLEGAQAPAGATARESKRLSASAITVMQRAVSSRPGASSTPLTAEAADMLLGATQPSTANQYTTSVNAFHQWCQLEGANPDSGTDFAAYTTYQARDHSTSSTTRSLFAGMNFYAGLAGRPSPARDPAAIQARAAIQRRLGQREARKTPIFASDLVVQRPKTSTSEGPETFKENAGRVHMLVLQAARLRFDDAYRANLGDLVVIPNSRIDVCVFGSKTDTKRMGQQSPVPFSSEKGSAWVELFSLLKRGATRFAALPEATRDGLIDAFVAAVGPDPGPDTLASFPAGCLDPLIGMHSSSSGALLPVRRLPLFGHWLSKNHLSLATELTGRATYKPLLRDVKAAAALAGLDPTTVGSHGLRRGGAFEMEAADAPLELISIALRHTSSASTQRYLSPALKASRIATIAGPGLPSPPAALGPPDLTPVPPSRRGRGTAKPRGKAPRGRGGSTTRTEPPPTTGGGSVHPDPSPLHHPGPGHHGGLVHGQGPRSL